VYDNGYADVSKQRSDSILRANELGSHRHCNGWRRNYVDYMRRSKGQGPNGAKKREKVDGALAKPMGIVRLKAHSSQSLQHPPEP
jgi:hypothetical protein